MKLNLNQEINFTYENNQINENQGNMYQLLNNINDKSINNIYKIHYHHKQFINYPIN